MQTSLKDNQLSQVAAEVSHLLKGASKPSPNAKPYSKEDFLKEVFMQKEKYEQLEGLLKTKKNIVLQGAPGVGKTYAARRLAWALQGSTDDSRIKIVQFHQSYCYEDFVGGFRPTSTGFEATLGVFADFCLQAASHSGDKYFFIIDEINRGNISKILGELLMLIEADKRGTSLDHVYSTTLPFSNSLIGENEKTFARNFFVPDNLYIIGMMNTADRSLAMMDYALRRRFAFFDIEPAFENELFLKLEQTEKGKKVLGKIKELNQQIIEDLGHGFQIGHCYFCKENLSDSELASIVSYEIYPTLQEYWFDEESKIAMVDEWYNSVLDILK